MRNIMKIKYEIRTSKHCLCPYTGAKLKILLAGAMSLIPEYIDTHFGQKKGGKIHG